MSFNWAESFTAEPVRKTSAPLVLDEVINELPLDVIECPDLRAIGEMWLELPRESGDRLPDWAMFNPAMISRYLSKVSILHVGDWRAGEVEFTLYGDHLTKNIGNGRPLNLEALRSDAAGHVNYCDIVTRVGRAIEFAAPQYARKTLCWDGHDDVEYEVLVLPFKPDQTGMSRVMQPATCQPRPD
jgi:hypothetical protein